MIPSKEKMNDLSLDQIKIAFSTFHKYNVIKSLEEVKLVAQRRWIEYYMVIASTGN